MSEQSDISKKVKDALESLDGIQRAEPAPFFFTRLQGRLQRQEKNIWETAGSFIARPVIVIASLLFVVCINAYILFEKNNATIDPPVASQITLPVEEYVLTAANSNYDYENIEP